MPTITFTNENKTLTIAAGTTILTAARQAGVMIEAPCNGLGTCGKCRVKIHRATSAPDASGADTNAIDTSVLACQTTIEENLAVVTRDHAAENKTLKIIAGGSSIAYDLHPQITRAGAVGAVVDIGTTTLVAALIDLKTGAELAKQSALNPQSQYAQDVLSRIHFGSTPAGLATLQQVFLDALNAMLAELIAGAGITRDQIAELVYSGNTTMLHLAGAVDPRPLGQFPYLSNIVGGEYVAASKWGVTTAAPDAQIYLPPIISAYVGADITSGILATDLAKLPGITVFIDIGTNGEMALAHDGKLAAASTAAGPAFEGMNIVFGMRAGHGAIETFTIGAAGEIAFNVIGGGEATGICGSGLLDLAGELVRVGVIGKTGRFNPAGDFPAPLQARLREIDGKKVFFITDKVYLALKDVRQIQLAKGAIRVGIEILLRKLNLSAAQVDRVIIAGSFGYHLNENALLNIGLLPAPFAGKIEFAGNTSLSGGVAFLLNTTFRDAIAALVQHIDKVELANDPEFERTFVSYLNF